MIKAIIFDFFGVLITEGFKRFCDIYFPDDKEKRRLAIELVTKHDAGAITKEQYTSGLAKLAGVGLEAVNENMNDNTPNDLLLDYIRKELKPKYKIGVLSNSGDDYISQMLKPEDLKTFDDIILSYRHGMIKPQKEIFEMSGERLGVKTSECIFIDDSPSHCAGARAAGMQAILYQNFGQMKADLEAILKS